MGKRSNIIHQMKKNLKEETKYGHSKFKDKQEALLNKERGNDFQQVRGIYSTSTYNCYDKSCTHFINFVLKNHRDVKSYDECREYVEEYLNDNIERGLSAWTIHARACALASSYHCSKNDFDVNYPLRERANITRSRSSDFSIITERQERIREFVRATGARRGGLMRLTKDDLRERDGKLEIHLCEKNGMERWARIDPSKEDYIREMFENKIGIEVNNEIRLFTKEEINCCQELHSCRSEYAVRMYSVFEKEGYANNQLYYCRKDMKGISLDKGILKEVSENLGHHRLDVVVSHYLYK